jgi:proteic killer suppression protein
MIKSFGNNVTEDLFHGRRTRRTRHLPPEVARGAIRKLDVLNAAQALVDLRSPPGNRLEALKGNLEGFYSIRVNDQWRIIFRWQSGDSHDVSIVDYHQ